MGGLLKALGSHYSKPDTDRRVTFDRATAPQPAEQPPVDGVVVPVEEGQQLLSVSVEYVYVKS